MPYRMRDRRGHHHEAATLFVNIYVRKFISLQIATNNAAADEPHIIRNAQRQDAILGGSWIQPRRLFGNSVRGLQTDCLRLAGEYGL